MASTKADPAATWEDIDSLVPWAENPNEHSPEELENLCRIMIAGGWGAVLLVRLANREIIAGHGRRKAVPLLARKWAQTTEADREKWHPDARRVVERKQVPVRWLDVSAEMAHTLALADNRIPEDRKIDRDALADAVAELGAEAASLAGFTNDEILDMLTPDVESELVEIDVSHVDDKYWISITGQLPEQPDALQRVREILALIPGAEVSIGTTRR
jgi:hypothetical protein